jgi:hypothetical protein
VGDYIIDTNVLLVASAQHPDSPFKDSNVPVEQAMIVLDWLMAFRADTQRKLVLDHRFKIWDEYHNQMTRGQDIGSLVATEKLQFARFVDIEFDENGHGCLPAELEKVVHDLSDRKFVAVALRDISQGEKSTIINAVDTDWCGWEKALKRAAINLKHLFEGLCEDEFAGSGKEKRQKRAKR